MTRASVVSPFLFALMLGGAAFAQGSPKPEEAMVPIGSDGLTMYAEVFKPTSGSPPFPVLIYTHGRSGTPEERANIPEVIPRDYLAFWLERGFAVVAPARPGYGRTGGPDREIPGHRWEPNGTCSGRPDYERMLNIAARAPMAVLDWLRDQPWADTKRVIISGNSVGGLTSVLVASMKPPGVVGYVNFAGGVGGNAGRAPGRSCDPQQIERLVTRAGSATKVRGLWIYSQNDQSWGPTAPKAWHDAFAAGGASSTFVLTGELPGRDGHDLIFFGRALWEEPLAAFLKTLQ